MSADHDYEALGLVAGLEIHQQLDTRTKLFCNCPTERREPENATRRFGRFLHATRSELGEVDVAASAESEIERRFEYLAYDSTCLVEADEEPPGEIDDEAIKSTLVIAALLGMSPVDFAEVMRKIVVDGSNTSGFQRSALVATNGEIDTDEGPVGIEDLMLEEESAARIEETDRGTRYGLDRLGIPLVEIGTAPDIRSPEHARATAERIGMLLRSTGAVKRGLGTIRQDVNVSIAEGARVELKGVQSLDTIDEIVEAEVARQVELVSIAEELQEREASVDDPTEVSSVFEGTDSGVLRGGLGEDSAILAVRLAGFDGLVGRELQADRRLGTEFADHAKRHGAGGIFHTDELPAYGITEAEVETLREAVGADADDAVAMVAAGASVADAAIEAVAERAETALSGVPGETRDANEDATSRYLRPLAGAARMYPETDVPAVPLDFEGIETPELLTETVERYQNEYDLDAGLAEQVAYGRHRALFETVVAAGTEPTLAAGTLESTLTELRRDGVVVEKLDEERLAETFALVREGEVTSEALDELLVAMAERPEQSASETLEATGLGSAEESEVETAVSEVVERNEGQIEAEGMGAFSGLMGECMAELGGGAEGEVVSELLREEIRARS